MNLQGVGSLLAKFEQGREIAVYTLSLLTQFSNECIA